MVRSHVAAGLLVKKHKREFNDPEELVVGRVDGQLAALNEQLSRIEADVELDIELRGLEGGPVAYYRTTRSEDCALVTELTPDEDGVLRAVVPELSIFTLTTLR